MTLKLFNGDQQLFKSASTLDTEGIPDLTAGEILDLEYTFMLRTDNDAAPWSLVEPSGYSLQIGLFAASTRTQLAYQNSFVDVPASSKKTGTLALDTGAITTALTGIASLRCVLEIRTVDATGADYPYRNKAVSLINPFITSGTLTVPPTETAATETWAKALFVPRDGSNVAVPCDQIILLSRPSGLTKILTISDDGVLQVTSV